VHNRVTVAPEVAARIVTRHVGGEPVSVIGRALHPTPGEVLPVLRSDRLVAVQPSQPLARMRRDGH